MAEPQITLIFCEDTRDEVGNKVSLMGLLGAQISLDGTEQTSGRMKNLVTGVLCRFFDSSPKEAEFEIRFIAASEAEEVPPQPKLMPVKIESPGDEAEWTANILGHFQNLPVHKGMRIESCFRLEGKQYSASLEIV